MNIQKTNTQEKNTPKNNTQEELNEYFGKNIWEPSVLENWEYSGIQLVDKVKPHEYVIDVGCGFNVFKDKIPNLLGIDPANNAADIKISIEEFEPDDKFDVAFCLGSIHFGDELKITKQISKVVSILKDTSRIYWRCNPGYHDHDDELCSTISFFPWTKTKMEFFANMFNYQIEFMTFEKAKHTNRIRLYSEWIRR